MSFVYIIYDGRAEYDIDGAAVLEALTGAFEHRDYETWRDHDAVLVQYRSDHEELTDERFIGHWRDGYAALKSRCG